MPVFVLTIIRKTTMSIEKKSNSNKVDRTMKNKDRRIIANCLPLYGRKKISVFDKELNRPVETEIIDRSKPIKWTPQTIQKWLEEFKSASIASGTNGLKVKREKHKSTPSRKKVHYSELAASLDREEKRSIS